MVNWENYEEYMLLYADAELNDAEKQALLAFVAAHPELRKELDAYKATQLVPDTQVIFANKDALIKEEAPKRAIALGKWWAYAAAAAVILFAVMIIKQNNTHEDNNVPVAKTETINQPAPITADTSKDLHSTPANPVTIENNIAKQEPAKAPVPKQHISPKQVIPAPQQQTKPETYITKEEPKKVIAPAPVTEQKREELVAVNQPVIEKTVTADESAPQVAKEERKRRGLLAFLPIRKEKKEGLDVLANAVNDKLDKVKNLRDNLKDTDVSVKIGNTELFVVKL